MGKCIQGFLPLALSSTCFWSGLLVFFFPFFFFFLFVLKDSDQINFALTPSIFHNWQLLFSSSLLFIFQPLLAVVGLSERGTQGTEI